MDGKDWPPTIRARVSAEDDGLHYLPQIVLIILGAFLLAGGAVFAAKFLF